MNRGIYGEQRGFQLIELLVVTVIIAIGTAVSVPSLTGSSDKAHDSRAKQAIAVAGKLAKAVYLENNGSYPATDELPDLLRDAEGTDVYSFRTHIGYVSTSTGPDDVSVRSVDGHTFHACTLARTGRQFCGVFRDPADPASGYATEGVFTDFVESAPDRLIFPDDDAGHKGYATSARASMFKPLGSFEVGAWVILWQNPSGSDATIAAHGCTWSNGNNCRTDNTGWSLAIDNNRRVHFAIATNPAVPAPVAAPTQPYQGVFAGPAPSTLTVAVSSQNGGTGSVSSSPAGISCPSDCIETYSSGMVTLTPTPAVGSVFVGWSGACTGAGACSPNLNQNRAVTATFNTTKTLTVSKTGAGTGTVSSAPAGISCGALCTASFGTATSVVLTATPAVGSRFTGWSGGCSGTGSCTVSMSSDRAAAANFLPTKSLTVSLAGTGSGSVSSNPAGINCSPTCTASFDEGTTVTLTAAPAVGSTFSGWSGACSGTGSCVVTMSSNQAVTATFATTPVTRSLSVNFAGSGAGTVTSSPAGLNCTDDCSYDFIKDTSVALTALAAANTTFSGWSGAGCSGTGSCVVSMNANRNVTATFVLTTYMLAVGLEGAGTVTSSPSGVNCTADCSQDFLEHAVVVLTATPASGSRFTGWSGDCSGIDTCVVAMSVNHDATANFAPATGAIEWVSEDWEQPSECQHQNNPATPLSLNTWHYVSAHFDPYGRITVYVDGQRQECSGLIGGVAGDIASSEPLYIGAQVNPAQNAVGFLGGAVAELRMTAGDGPAHVADPGPRSSPGRLESPAENGLPASFLFHFEDHSDSAGNLEDFILHGYVALGY